MATTGGAPLGDLADTVEALRALLTAGDQFRHITAAYFGLGDSDTRALHQLSNSGGSLSPTELARQLNLSSSSLTALLDRLDSAGLSRRHPHPEDRRRSVVTLTDRGIDVVTHIEDWVGAALAPLDPSLLPQATILLTRITAALETQATDLARAITFTKSTP